MNENEKYLNLTDDEEVELVMESIRDFGIMDVSNRKTEQLGKGTRTLLRYIWAVKSSNGELSDLISKFAADYLDDND